MDGVDDTSVTDNLVPRVREISYIDPLAAFARFADDPFAIFFDSALSGNRFGRHSFIAVDPFLTITSKNGRIEMGDKSLVGDPFEVVRQRLAAYPLATIEGLPPFQTGAAGYFGYDLCHHLERVPACARDDLGMADLVVGFYDVVIGFDHRQHRAWVVSSGYPENEPGARKARARAREAAFLSRLDAPWPQEIGVRLEVGGAPATSNFERAAYEEMVRRVIDYIHAGDIYQANVSQRFTAEMPPSQTPLSVYRRLREHGPAAFAAYFDLGDAVIASASPERFLFHRDGWVETRPIKGTRPRGASEAEDRALAAELLASDKDRAENLMIVDLLRNDLSRVCRYATVITPELFALETYATVHHLVSTVQGRLTAEATAIDLLRAAFPGGSITGAPKIRAMEIIAELEPVRRGPFFGSLGYIGFDGTMDTNIAIRTLVMKDGVAAFQVGGGIVADSVPAREYEETLTKAEALFASLGSELRVCRRNGK